jgi:hypothetical protein
MTRVGFKCQPSAKAVAEIAIQPMGARCFLEIVMVVISLGARSATIALSLPSKMATHLISTSYRDIWKTFRNSSK